MDIALLRTIFRGTGAYPRSCQNVCFIVQFGASWNIFSKNVLLRKYI